ncbi:MAG: hypothetical protein EBU08_19360 [Micrococcales bacterium]|nr:hypothetical protein [Micrococcales bacterium]
MTVNRNGVDQGAVSKRTVTAKGNLIVGTANSVVSNLAVGNDGETLVADSSTSTGLRYQGSQAAGKNAIINGAFDIWQRGTSGTIAAGSYVAADRWYTYRNTTGSTFSRQSASLTGFQYSGRIARDSGNTATANIGCGQSIESINSIPFAGQTVVLSFWAKAGANFSATSSILRVRLLSSTITDQNIVLNGGTTVIDQNVTLTTSWQRFSYTAAVGSTAVTLGNIFSYDPTGTAGAGDNFEVTGVQLELGSVATSFQRAGGTIQGELAACCYYYERLVSDATYTAFGAGFYTTGSRLFVNVPYQRKRVAPLLAFSNVAGWWGSGSLGAATIATSYIGKTSAGLDVSVSGGSTSTGFGGILSSNNNTAGYIELNSEL